MLSRFSASALKRVSGSGSATSSLSANRNVIRGISSVDKLVIVEHDNSGITHLVLNRDEGKNSLSKAMLKEFTDAVMTLHDDESTNVVVISSSVPRVFCAGADLKERKTMAESEIPNFVEQLRNAFTAVDDLPMPVIAAIEGAALGGGLELALACDLRICSHSSTLGLPETALAIIPGAGGTQRLPRALGLQKAKELVYTAARMKGPEAQEIGLVMESVPDGTARDRAVEIAQKINAGGPVALRMAKQAINKGIQGTLKQGLEVEKTCYAKVVPTQDRVEGLLAFAEKRKPVYTGK
jgi:methylglutaconyl-CoA hydratase